MWTRVADAVLPAAGGVLVASSLPPWGWWPLAWVGYALLAWRLAGSGWRRRAVAGAAFGLGMFLPGLWWVGEFNVLGAAVLMVFETLFLVAAAVAVTGGRGRMVALPAAVVLAEAARGSFPYGGLPMAGPALGQVGGPLAGAARVGGALLVAGLTATAGVGLGAVVARRWRAASVAAGVVVLLTALGAAAPDGGPAVGTTRVAAVQGGGVRGMLAIETDPADVLDAHVAASQAVRPPVDLILWPEDVVDVDQPIAVTQQASEVAATAVAHRAPLIAGVVEDSGEDRFLNAAVVWSADGRIVGRYDKVHRVPFGEYVPARGFFSHLADLSVVPRDAVAGHGSGMLRTPAGPVGIVVSFEVYFPERARSAIRAGGRLLLVPTNASSFRTSQVPTTEVATARLRAIETGRDVVQAAPTGYGAFIDNRGRLLARTTLGRRQVLQRAARIRAGRTVYMRLGDAPVTAIALLQLVTAWAIAAGRRYRGRRGRDGDAVTPPPRRPTPPEGPRLASRR